MVAPINPNIPIAPALLPAGVFIAPGASLNLGHGISVKNDLHTAIIADLTHDPAGDQNERWCLRVVGTADFAHYTVMYGVDDFINKEPPYVFRAIIPVELPDEFDLIPEQQPA